MASPCVEIDDKKIREAGVAPIESRRNPRAGIDQLQAPARERAVARQAVLLVIFRPIINGSGAAEREEPIDKDEEYKPTTI